MSALVLDAATGVRSPEGPGGQAALDHLPYFADLLGPYDLKADEELLRRGAGVTHRRLAELVTDADGVRDSRPQLIVVAHALPDVVPFTAVAPHLTERLGGDAVNFGLSQQGLGAPFTALRIAAAHVRSGRATDVCVAVLQQTTLPTELPPLGRGQLTDSAAALLLRTGPSAGRLELAGAGQGPPPPTPPGRTLHVLGPAPDDSDLPHGVDLHHSAPGSYCTAVWLELAAHWREWQDTYDTVVLRDTDPRTGAAHHAVFRAAAPAGAAS
ncbi:hypothetical protein DY218_28265 [Streptomyces triticagri]|uniref:3-oxoacyl-ACP synthase n=1 Tax=Streptomyces triticagri TaxID=2293568 RepID=A0A372LXD9_9ACTN|nr:hypothetical protein [Streptomyces triticagri]RFU83332.1 hypothetical protein DY218_28265 [Streptomyces triticagri]